MSYHRHITSEQVKVKPESGLWRNTKKIDWAWYEEELAVIVKHLPDRLRMGYEIEHCAARSGNSKALCSAKKVRRL